MRIGLKRYRRIERAGLPVTLRLLVFQTSEILSPYHMGSVVSFWCIYNHNPVRFARVSGAAGYVRAAICQYYLACKVVCFLLNFSHVQFTFIVCHLCFLRSPLFYLSDLRLTIGGLRAEPRLTV